MTDDEPDRADRPCICGENRMGDRVHHPDCPAHNSDRGDGGDAANTPQEKDVVVECSECGNRQIGRDFIGGRCETNYYGGDCDGRYEILDYIGRDAETAEQQRGGPGPDGPEPSDSRESGPAAAAAPSPLQTVECPICGYRELREAADGDGDPQ